MVHQILSCLNDRVVILLSVITCKVGIFARFPSWLFRERKPIFLLFNTEEI